MGLFGAPRRSQLPEPNVFAEQEAAAPFAPDSTRPEPDPNGQFGQVSPFAQPNQLFAQPNQVFAQPNDASAPYGQPFTIDLSSPMPETAWSPGQDANRVDVQVIGNGFQVNGVLVTGRFDRLSDWLNMQQGWVHVDEGALFRPGEDADAARKPRTNQWVRLNEVVLVAEHSAAKRDRGGTPGYVRKERRRVTIVTHGYTLRGYIHLVESGTMQSFLETADPHFIPMTDVVVRWLANEQLVSHLPFALVNRSQLISVSEEVPKPEVDDERVEPAAETEPEPADAWLRSA